MTSEINLRYFVEAAAKALDILESFDSPEENLSIAEIVQRTGMTYCSTFRLIYTLERRGYVMRTPDSKRYRLVPVRKRFRLGYTALDQHCPYSEAITHGLVLAARAAGVELVVRDNSNNPAKAIANVDSLLDEGVHLMIVHQPHEPASKAIAAHCQEKKVPLLAIDHAHPGAYYLGVNNHQAGWSCGEHLWRTSPESLRLLVLAPAPMNEARRQFVRGLAEGLRWTAGSTPDVVSGPHHSAYDWVRQALKDAGASVEDLCIVAASDMLANASIRALASLGCGGGTTVVGFGGSPDAVVRLRRGEPRAAALACFPETYGDQVIPKALRILAGEPASSVCHTQHVLLTAANLDDYYPDNRSSRVCQIPEVEPAWFQAPMPAATLGASGNGNSGHKRSYQKLPSFDGESGMIAGHPLGAQWVSP